MTQAGDRTAPAGDPVAQAGDPVAQAGDPVAPAGDPAAVVASLAAHLDRLAFTGLSVDEVTALIIDAVAAWGTANRWRVYRRAPSVLTLPPPMDRRHSVLDVALARPDGPPLAVEVDHTHRTRTAAKLLAEARAGRVAVWVRWGPGGFRAPPGEVRMVTVEVTRRGRLNSRGHDRPPPAHSTGVGAAVEMQIPMGHP